MRRLITHRVNILVELILTTPLYYLPGGGVRIRTGVRGFAGPCLTARPRRQNREAYRSATKDLLCDVAIQTKDTNGDDHQLDEDPSESSCNGDHSKQRHDSNEARHDERDEFQEDE